MIILDQDKMTMLNSDQMIGFGLMQDADKYLIVAIVNTGGTTILLGKYQTEEMATAVRQQLMLSFNMQKNIFEMPEDAPIIPLEIIKEE